METSWLALGSADFVWFVPSWVYPALMYKGDKKDRVVLFSIIGLFV